jgi:hypothetical protein
LILASLAGCRAPFRRTLIVCLSVASVMCSCYHPVLGRYAEEARRRGWVLSINLVSRLPAPGSARRQTDAG